MNPLAPRLLLVPLAILVLLPGCTSPGANSLDEPPVTSFAGAFSLLEGGGFRIDQPVDVYLVGFPDAMAQQLQERLPPVEVFGAASDVPVNVPPSPEGVLGVAPVPLPAIPRAVYRVTGLPSSFASDFFAHASSAKLADDTFDANAAEDYLAANIPAAARPWDANRPALVILHGQAALPENHAWRYTYPSGYLEPVRAFGERHPFLVFDVSARPDPYVTENRLTVEGTFFRTVFGDTPVPPYNYPMPPEGEATLANLVNLTVDATRHRLLQPALYPVSTRPCHHLTILLAIHTSSLAEADIVGRKARDNLDVPSIERALNNLTGGGVEAELKVLELPVDDPALDAFVRSAGNGALIVFPFLDAMRWYFDQNWQQYVDARPGCEEYLSVSLFGDLATRSDFGGIGTYDVQADRRISFSVWPELRRLQATYDGPGREVVSTGSASEDEWNTLNVLVAHETGHIFGQNHPQDITLAEEGARKNDAFQSVWSVMSYETNWRVHDFGDLDTSNWQRNRAGYLLQQAQRANLEDTPEFAAAVQALTEYRWADAFEHLEARIPDDARAVTPEAGGTHRHDEWLPRFDG